MAKGARSRVTVGMGKIWLSIGLMVLAPVIAFAAVLLVQLGVVPLAVGLDILTLKVAMGMAFVALAFAVVSVLLSLKQFARLGAISLVVLMLCGMISAGFVVRARALDVVAPLDVSTNLNDPPVVAGATGPVQACAGVSAVPSQIAIEGATYVLVHQGYRITDAQLFQVRGQRRGFWFGMRHEAVIRIRPGQTDVRVTALYDHRDGGETCRLAGELVTGLEAGLQAGR